MANKDKFMEMLEYVINNDSAKAEELFHQIVVEKSREIYENILNEEYSDLDLEEASKEDDEEEMDEAAQAKEEDEEIDEASHDEEDEEMDEMFGMEAEVGGDPTDDMISDVEAGDEEEDEEGEEGEGEIEDRVMDLEDALDDLKAEFQKLMDMEAGEEEHADELGDMGMDDEGEEKKDEYFAPSFEEEIEELDLSPAEQMREYVEKIGDAYKGGKVASSSETGGPNTKSPVAGKNDMGGTTANIAKGGTGSEKGTAGGLLNPSTKEDNAGNVNVPGAKSATKLSAVSKGHGAEKKGAGEAAGTDKKSLFR